MSVIPFASSGQKLWPIWLTVILTPRTRSGDMFAQKSTAQTLGLLGPRHLFRKWDRNRLNAEVRGFLERDRCVKKRVRFPGIQQNV
jgi:hypothetical protein